MSKSKVEFNPDYDQEFEQNEREWIIYNNDADEEVGRLRKHTAWSGSAWTVTHYEVSLDDDDYTKDDDEKYRDFEVKGFWAGNGGYGGVFSNRRGHPNSRKALAAAKRWTRRQLEAQ